MTATGGELRIATWNVWRRFGSNWQARQPAILETLRDIDADLDGRLSTLVRERCLDCTVNDQAVRVLPAFWPQSRR